MTNNTRSADTRGRNPWVTHASKVVYANPWISVREDQVTRPDGKPGIYGVIDIRPSIGVLALNERDEAILVGQWRYSLNRYSWEITRGGSHPGETDMVAVAQRELAEETGLVAAHWTSLGTVDICNGVANDVQSLFLATGLSSTSRQLDPEEEIALEWRPFSTVVEMVMDGRITEVCSIAAILKAARLRAEVGSGEAHT